MADDFDRGRQVGKYELITRLSIGGMAELYLAFLPGPGGFKKFVALKQILPDARNDEQFVKMFLDEARITASLNHPHIGQVFDLGRDEKSDQLFLAMEFIAGQDLGAVIQAAARAGVKIPIPLACRVVRDLCLGLHAAHTFVDPSGRAQPVIHRDVAPKNVMVSYAGHVKVIDFGIARAKGRLIRTQTGQVRGTQSYMSPEQIQDLPMDHRSDLFSVGIVLHELLTGERLYPSSTPASIMRLIRDAPVDPCEKAPAVPRALGAVVLQALAKEPGARFQSGKAFARAIEAACPQLADDDAIAAFMGQLFAAQLESSRALFEAAQADAAPDALSAFVAKMNVPEPAEAARATPLQRPSVLRASTETRPSQRVSAKPWALGGVVGGAVLIVGVILWSGGAEPAATPLPTPAVPITSGALGAIRRGNAALDARDYGVARAAFGEALSVEPGNYTALFGAGVAARRSERWGEARRLFQQANDAAKVPRDGAMATFELGCVLARLTEPDLAMASLQKAVGVLGVESFAEPLAHDPDLDSLRALPPFVILRGEKPPLEVTRSAAEPLSPTSLELFNQATAEKKAKNYERAIVLMEKCVKLQPKAHPCLRLLGSLYASIATRDQSKADLEKARKYYERFLEVAPPDDEHVPKLKQLLLAK